MSSKEHAMVLEISGKNGDLEQYKKSLCEASLLHIDKVMFCSVWDDEEEIEIHYTEELIPFCESLGITILPLNIGYADRLFDGDAAVVVLSGESENDYPSFSSLITLDEYKQEHGIETEPEEVYKIFAKLK